MWWGGGKKISLSNERVTAVTRPDTTLAVRGGDTTHLVIFTGLFSFFFDMLRELSAPPLCNPGPSALLSTSFTTPLLSALTLPCPFLVSPPCSSSPAQGASTCLSSSQAGRCVSKSGGGADREDLFRHPAPCFFVLHRTDCYFKRDQCAANEPAKYADKLFKRLILARRGRWSQAHKHGVLFDVATRGCAAVALQPCIAVHKWPGFD